MQILSVPATEVRPMRSAVLRPYARPEELVYAGDEVAGALHAVAREGRRTVGVVSIAPDPHPHEPRPGDWRIRGMATDPSVRGTGVGAALLRYVLDHARAHGGERVWCNARTSAVGFYQRVGMHTEGAEFELGRNGPHYLMSAAL